MKKDKGIIYAIEVERVSSTDLSQLKVKIGRSKNVDITLQQYKRSNPNAEVLDCWASNSALSLPTCEKGVHLVAEKYANKRERETFIFLDDDYKNFSENINLLLKNNGKNTKNVETTEYKRSGYTGKTPKQFIFLNKVYEVNTWREILVKISSIIYKKHKNFGPAFKLSKKRVYFSKNKDDLYDPLEVPNSPFFCEGWLSANSIIRIIKRLLNILEYKEEDFKIIIM